MEDKILSLTKGDFGKFMKMMESVYGKQWTNRFQEQHAFDAWYKVFVQIGLSLSDIEFGIKQLSKNEQFRTFIPNMFQFIALCRLGDLPSAETCFNELYSVLLQGKFWENALRVHPITLKIGLSKPTHFWATSICSQVTNVFTEQYQLALEEIAEIGQVNILIPPKMKLKLNFSKAAYPLTMYNLLHRRRSIKGEINAKRLQQKNVKLSQF